MESRIIALEKKSTDYEKRISRIEGDRQLQEFQYKQIIENLQELKGDVKELKKVPSKRWELIIASCITAILGYTIAYIIGNVL